MTNLKRFAQGLAWLALASCGGGDPCTGPTCPNAEDPGFVIVSFNSSISTIGAIQVLIPTPSGVTADSFTLIPSGFDGYFKDVSGGTRLIMFGMSGPFSNGDAFEFWVPDRDAITSFTPTREAAADRNTFALYAATDFTISIRKVPGGIFPSRSGRLLARIM